MAFLNAKYTKESLILALPVMITQVGQVSVNLFDNIIVGKLLGADALASVSLGNAVFFSVFLPYATVINSWLKSKKCEQFTASV